MLFSFAFLTPHAASNALSAALHMPARATGLLDNRRNRLRRESGQTKRAAEITDTYGAEVEVLRDRAGRPVFQPASAIDAWPAAASARDAVAS